MEARNRFKLSNFMGDDNALKLINMLKDIYKGYPADEADYQMNELLKDDEFLKKVKSSFDYWEEYKLKQVKHQLLNMPEVHYMRNNSSLIQAEIKLPKDLVDLAHDLLNLTTKEICEKYGAIEESFYLHSDAVSYTDNAKVVLDFEVIFGEKDEDYANLKVSAFILPDNNYNYYPLKSHTELFVRPNEITGEYEFTDDYSTAFQLSVISAPELSRAGNYFTLNLPPELTSVEDINADELRGKIVKVNRMLSKEEADNLCNGPLYECEVVHTGKQLHIFDYELGKIIPKEFISKGNLNALESKITAAESMKENLTDKLPVKTKETNHFR